MGTPSRRRFLQASSVGLAWAASSVPTCALDPIRSSEVSGDAQLPARIKGLSLATYSLRPKMRWFKGKLGRGKLMMSDFLDYCAKENFDAAELTAYFFEHPVSAQRLAGLKRQAHILGLDISGGAIGNDFGHPPGSDKGKQELEYTRKWLDHYSDLGAPTVRIFAGRSRPEGASDEQVIDNVCANLEQILPHAEKRGVMLGIENHDFLTQIDRMLALLKRIESPWLGVTWDSGNLSGTEDPYAALEKIAPYAITAQLKVKTKMNDKPVDADPNKLVDILTSAQFRGYLVLEYEEAEDAFAAIPKFKQDVEKAIAAGA